MTPICSTKENGGIPSNQPLPDVPLPSYLLKCTLWNRKDKGMTRLFRYCFFWLSAVTYRSKERWRNMKCIVRSLRASCLGFSGHFGSFPVVRKPRKRIFIVEYIHSQRIRRPSTWNIKKFRARIDRESSRTVYQAVVVPATPLPHKKKEDHYSSSPLKASNFIITDGLMGTRSNTTRSFLPFLSLIESLYYTIWVAVKIWL